MTAIRLDGKATAAQIKQELSERVAALKERGIVPGIGTVLVGADPASQLYVGMKHRQSEAIGKLCRQVANVCDPTRIVIGGGFIEGGPELTARVMSIIDRTFRKIAFKKHAAEVKIEPARAGDQAGCLGAALSAWQAANAHR